MNTIQAELKRCTRTLKGLEYKEAKARAYRLTMQELGVSSTNIVFDTDLAELSLDPEVVKILKEDPTLDHNLMYERCPVTPHTSSVTASSRSGDKPLCVYDRDVTSYYDRYTLGQLDNPRSATQSVIAQLPLFIHDLAHWKKGFNPVKYRRFTHKLKKTFAVSFHAPEQITQKGTVSTRKKRIARRIPRVQSQSVRY